MNKLIVTIITTLLLTAAGTTLAEDFYGEPGKKGHRQHGGMQSMPAVGQLMREIRHLNLDAEQEASIKTVIRNLKARIRPVMAETKAGHQQLKALIKADSYDENAIAAVAENEGKLAAERLMITSRALSEVYGHLTDEQREKLELMAAERKGKHGKKHQQPSTEG